MGLSQLGDGLQPVHLGHFDVERHDVGVQRGDLLQTYPTVDGRVQYLEIGVRVDDIGNETANHDRVIDDENLDSHGVAPARMPSISSLSRIMSSSTGFTR